VILLDTDVMIDLLRRYPPAIAWLESLGEEELALPGFVVMELLQGCRNKAEQERVQSTLQPYGVVWPSVDTCNAALLAFANTHLSQGLGLLDALIGQTAVALGVTLYTFNKKHYAAIPTLQTLRQVADTAISVLPKGSAV
jgi:predicted nucleic acid-binding protein